MQRGSLSPLCTRDYGLEPLEGDDDEEDEGEEDEEEDEDEEDEAVVCFLDEVAVNFCNNCCFRSLMTA